MAEYVGSGEYGKRGKEYNPNVGRYDYFEAPVTINGKGYIVSFDVASCADVNNYRTHRLVDIAITPQGPSNQIHQAGLSSAGSAGTPAVSNITQGETAVNSESQNAAQGAAGAGGITTGAQAVQGEGGALNAPQGVQAELAGQSPRQTTLDIYQNRGTRQENEAVQVGRATTIKKPYAGVTPTQEGVERVVVPVSDDSLALANSRIEQAENDTSGRSLRSILSAAYKQTFHPQKNIPVNGMTYEGQLYTVDIGRRVPGKVISDPNLSAEKISVLDALPEVIQNAQYVGSGEYGKAGKTNSETVRYDYFETDVTIGGKEYTVLFDVEVLPSANNYRTHRLVDIAITPQGPSIRLHQAGLSSAGSAGTPAASNITQGETAVNSKSQGDDGLGAAGAGGITTEAQATQSEGGVLNAPQSVQAEQAGQSPRQTTLDIYQNRGTRQETEAVQGRTTQSNIDNAADAAYTDTKENMVSGGVDNAGTGADNGSRTDTGAVGSIPSDSGGIPGVHEERDSNSQGRDGLGGVSVGSGFVLSGQAKDTIRSRGVAFVEARDASADSAAFSSALDEARASNPKNGWAVTPKSEREIRENGVRVYMDDNGSVGFGIAPDGDIEAVFANKSKGAPNRATASLIPQAIAAGGTKLDCYGTGLVILYAQHGFIPVARVAFNPEYANDGWDASKGTPDIYFMMATDTDADSVVRNFGKLTPPTKAELDALPLMDYESAYAYRDSLLAQQEAAQAPAVNSESQGDDGLGAANAGFDPVSRWQESTGRYHPVNEAAAQTTLEERGRVPTDVPVTDVVGGQVSKHVSTLVNANITTNEMAAALMEDARKGAFSAQPYTDAEAAAKVREHIEQVGWDVAFGEYRADIMSGKASKDISMTGIVLYNNAVNSGALLDAMDVAALMAFQSTHPLRGATLFRLWGVVEIDEGKGVYTGKRYEPAPCAPGPAGVIGRPRRRRCPAAGLSIRR